MKTVCRILIGLALGVAANSPAFAQNIPAIQFVNSSGTNAVAALNSLHTFTTSFKGKNDVTITSNNVSLPALWTDNYGATGPNGAGDNPPYVTGYIGKSGNGTGDGTAGGFEELQTYVGSVLTFRFAIPLTSSNRILVADIDNSEHYTVQAFSSGTALSLTGWTNQKFSGQTGETSDPSWGSWNPTGGGPYIGTLVANTYANLNEPLDILTPAAGQNVTKLIFTQTSATNNGTASLQIIELKGPAAGRYTLLLSATAAGSTVPQGTGWATMTVSNNDVAILAGQLSDGEGFSTSAGIVTGTSGSQVPIDTVLSYPSVTSSGATGSLAGTLTFDQLNGSDFKGTLNWVKPQQTKGAYPAAIDTNLSVIGSPYTLVNTGSSVLPGFTTGTLNMTDKGTLRVSGTTHLDQTVTLSSSNTLVLASPVQDQLTVTITPATGVFKGTFVYPGKKTPTAFDGVLFQDRITGGGFFLGPYGSGKVSLAPHASH